MARSLPDRRALVCDVLGPPSIAGPVVAASVGDPSPEGPTPSEGDWQRWLDVVREQRLANATLSAVRDGRLAPPSEVRDALVVESLGETTTSLAAEGSAVETIRLLQDEGLDPVLLKGASIAYRYYARPEDRPTRDVDLLLPAGQLAPAWDLLRARGYAPPLHGMDPAWVDRYAKGRTLVGPDGTEVDLHRTLSLLPFGLLVDLDALHASVVDSSLGGRTVRTLSDEGTFFHCCLHAVLAWEPIVLPHLDVVVTSRAGIDVDVVRRLAGDGPITSIVRAAVAEAEVLAPLAPEAHEVARSLALNPTGDRLLAWHRRRHRSFVASLVRSTPFVGGPLERVKYGASVGIGLARMAIGRGGNQVRRPSDA